MNADSLLFFDKSPAAVPLYSAFETQVLSQIPDVTIKVKKTQISFSNKRNFAFVSLLPVRKAKDRPDVYIVVTFGLNHRIDSPRIDVAVESYPNRWTHHVLIAVETEIDDELMTWIKAASEFSAAKR